MRGNRQHGRLKLHAPPETPTAPPVDPGVTAPRWPSWKFEGIPFTVQAWTEDEWRGLEARPPDAQLAPNGTWMAVRWLA